MPAAPALDRLRRLGPVFRSNEAISAGVSWRDLYSLRDDGEVVELSRGLYQLAETAGTGNVDFVVVCARAPHGMICVNSALAHWDLTTRSPARFTLRFPKVRTGRRSTIRPPGSMCSGPQSSASAASRFAKNATSDSDQRPRAPLSTRSGCGT